jgi:hypothetical protein
VLLICSTTATTWFQAAVRTPLLQGVLDGAPTLLKARAKRACVCPDHPQPKVTRTTPVEEGLKVYADGASAVKGLPCNGVDLEQTLSKHWSMATYMLVGSGDKSRNKKARWIVWVSSGAMIQLQLCEPGENGPSPSDTTPSCGRKMQGVGGAGGKRYKTLGQSQHKVSRNANHFNEPRLRVVYVKICLQLNWFD